LQDAAKLFNNPLFPISEYLLGGMLMQETEMGFGGEHIPQGDCAGRGDGGKGHGLAQADSSSGDFYYADGSNVGFNGEGRSNSSIPDLDKTVLLKPKLTNPAVIKALGKSEFGPYKWFDCRENILYSAAHHIYLAELVQGYGTGGFDSKLKGWGLNPAKDSNGKYSDPKTYKAAIQLYIDGNNAGQSLYRAKTGRYCTADAAGNVSDACSSDGVYGKQVFEYAVNVAKCFGVNTTIEEIINNTAPGGGSSVDCNASGNLNAQGAEFPLLTKKGVKVYYSQPYPFYIGGTTSDYKHDGIDMSPGPTDPENTRAAAVVDGEITNVFLVSSISITGGDNCTLENGYAPCKKNQILIELTENGTGKTFRYIHINPEKVKVKKGDKVTKGQELGIIDNFHFVHLHFEVRLNNVLQQPIEHIKGWNKDIQASNTRAESSVIDPALYQKLQ
jgi:murein DD-endopeptidase MepM/ murein hydrolase activator NlpD